MRFSDLIAVFALVFAIGASVYLSRRSKKQIVPVKLNTMVKIEPGTVKPRKKSDVSDGQLDAKYRGTFIVNNGRVELQSCCFFVRRKTHDDYTEIHMFVGLFDQDRQTPLVDTGHKINATPANEQSFRNSLDGAEAVRVEFLDVAGQVFRSPDLPVH